MYIKSIDSGGLDHRALKTRVRQLKWNHSYDVPEDQVESCICADIIGRFPYANSEEILTALRQKETYAFPVIHMENGKLIYSGKYNGKWIDRVEVYENGLTVYYAFRQVYYETKYIVEDIPKEHVCYIPEEHFYDMYRESPFIERFYHEAFGSYKEAKEFMESMEKHVSESELTILLHDYVEVTETEWYKENMKVVEELRLHPEKKDIFLVPVKKHLEEIKRRDERKID